MIHWFVTQIPGMLIGFVVGAFTPSVGRRIKGFFSRESKVIGSKL